MEIERKYLVKDIPEGLEKYTCKVIEQGYLCREPTIRIRKSNEDFILTYKSDLGVDLSTERKAKVLNEIEVPLTKEGYEHLKEKIDYFMVEKKRYIIPLEDNLTAELDIFEGRLKGLVLVEVEFPDEAIANSYEAPEWFGKDVSLDGSYTNGRLSTIERYSCE